MLADFGPLAVVSTTMKTRPSWCGVMRKIICALSPCRWEEIWDRYAYCVEIKITKHDKVYYMPYLFTKKTTFMLCLSPSGNLDQFQGRS